MFPLALMADIADVGGRRDLLLALVPNVGVVDRLISSSGGGDCGRGGGPVDIFLTGNPAGGGIFGGGGRFIVGGRDLSGVSVVDAARPLRPEGCSASDAPPKVSAEIRLRSLDEVGGDLRKS